MSKEIKIYTCGKMKGLTYEEQMSWRNNIQRLIENRFKYSYDGSTKLTFVHPPQYYRYDKDYQKSEREIMEWELNQIRDTDILIINAEGIGESVGSHFEMGVAWSMNHFGNKYISVIGINENEECLHPWIQESFLRVEDSMSDAADFIVEYLII